MGLAEQPTGYIERCDLWTYRITDTGREERGIMSRRDEYEA